jgi:hypothetical protein
MLFIVRRDSQLLGKLKRDRPEPYATTTIVETRRNDRYGSFASDWLRRRSVHVRFAPQATIQGMSPKWRDGIDEQPVSQSAAAFAAQSTLCPVMQM